MNRARTPPTMLKARPRTPPIGAAGASTVRNLEPPGSPAEPRARLSSTYDSRADTVGNRAKINSAQTPTDIGDQYLKLSPWSPGVTSMSMCQNFNQLAPRSTVSSSGQKINATKLV